MKKKVKGKARSALGEELEAASSAGAERDVGVAEGRKGEEKAPA